RFDGVPLKGGMVARYVCVNGEIYRKSFIEAGMPPEKVILTGSPDHDRLYEFRECLSDEDKSQIRAELNVSEKQPLITLFAQPFTERILPGIGNYADELLWITQQIAAIASEAVLVIKLHPNQRLEDFAALNTLPHVRVMGSEGGEAFNIRLTYASDLVILRTSTAGYLALALDVPLMTYAFYGHPGEDYFKDVGGSWHVQNRETFSEGIKTLLSDDAARHDLLEKQRRVREEHMLLDGQCCARIGAVLRDG
ncbi:MAG TPA: hypothetical protein VJZ27_04500, partial [Aggregatilineales bacterium]|nr:hypothetical protein [Aggregatilineales bacterium]